MSDLKVTEYDSLEDLEDTIERVNPRIVRLDREMETLLDEARSFLENNHVSDELRSSARYVDVHIPHKTMPTMVKTYAYKELDDPEQAENWDTLEEAQDRASGMMDRYKVAYRKLWEISGLEGEALADELEGEHNVEHFLDTWEEEPERLFRGIDSYNDRHELETVSGLHNPGTTMARYTGNAVTDKQQDDLDRGRVLGRELHDERSPEYSKNKDFWREILYWKPDYSKWVNEEKLEADRSI